MNGYQTDNNHVAVQHCFIPDSVKCSLFMFMILGAHGNCVLLYSYTWGGKKVNKNKKSPINTTVKLSTTNTIYPTVVLLLTTKSKTIKNNFR